MSFRSTLVVAVVTLATPYPAFAETEKEAREAIATFKTAYATKDEAQRVSAVEALGATRHKLIVEALSAPLEKDTAPVRRAAATALGGQWAPTAVSVLAKALDSEVSSSAKPDLAIALVAALGETRAEAAVSALTPLLVPKGRGADAAELSVLTGPALDALAKIGSPAAIEKVLAFVNTDAALHAKRRGPPTPSPLGLKAEATLSAITGERHSGATAWRRWWAENRDTLKPVPVFRCEGTGQLFDRPTPDTKCPVAEHTRCGAVVRTRLEGGHEVTPKAGKASGK